VTAPTVLEWDAFDDTLVELWIAEHADEAPTVAVDWAALGIDDPGSVDAYTLEALEMLELGGPRPWRAKKQVVTPRDSQRPPDGDWSVWLLKAGRGFGKTFSGANTLADWACEHVGDYAIVAPTFGDARKICVEGPSGIKQALGSELLVYNKSEYVLYLRNGSRIVLASADAPDRLRGWNLSGAWCDEVGSWVGTEAWYDALDFALREGEARVVVTTTPRRGNKILRDLLEQFKRGSADVVVTHGHTLENRENLSEKAIRRLLQRWDGTTLGRQELGGELLEDVEGALVSTELIERTRVNAADIPEIWRIAVGEDPATTSKEGSDETGLGVIGIGPAPRGWQPPAGKVVLVGMPHLYILQDATLKASPDNTARRALDLVDEWAADVLAAEVNQGGDYVETTTRLVAAAEGRSMPYFHAVHASVGKKARAEPVGGLWEQHRVHIVREAPGGTALLEDEWTGTVFTEIRESPNRVDWSVWAAVELMPELSAKGGTLIELISGAG